MGKLRQILTLTAALAAASAGYAFGNGAKEAVTSENPEPVKTEQTGNPLPNIPTYDGLIVGNGASPFYRKPVHISQLGFKPTDHVVVRDAADALVNDFTYLSENEGAKRIAPALKPVYESNLNSIASKVIPELNREKSINGGITYLEKIAVLNEDFKDGYLSKDEVEEFNKRFPGQFTFALVSKEDQRAAYMIMPALQEPEEVGKLEKKAQSAKIVLPSNGYNHQIHLPGKGPEATTKQPEKYPFDYSSRSPEELNKALQNRHGEGLGRDEQKNYSQKPKTSPKKLRREARAEQKKAPFINPVTPPVGFDFGTDYTFGGKMVGVNAGMIFGDSNDLVNLSYNFGVSKGFSSETSSTTTPKSDFGFWGKIDTSNSGFYSVNIGNTFYFGKGDLKVLVGGSMSMLHWNTDNSTSIYLGKTLFDGPNQDPTLKHSAVDYTGFAGVKYKGFEVDAGITGSARTKKITPYLGMKYTLWQAKSPEKRK